MSLKGPLWLQSGKPIKHMSSGEFCEYSEAKGVQVNNLNIKTAKPDIQCFVLKKGENCLSPENLLFFYGTKREEKEKGKRKCMPDNLYKQ